MNPRLDTRSDCGRIERMSKVEFEQSAVSVNAAIIGAGFAIEPALIQLLMRDGKLTSLGENGGARDTGSFRLTFGGRGRRAASREPDLERRKREAL